MMYSLVITMAASNTRSNMAKKNKSRRNKTLVKKSQGVSSFVNQGRQRARNKTRVGRGNTFNFAPAAMGSTQTYAGPNQGSALHLTHREQMGGLGVDTTFRGDSTPVSFANPNLVDWTAELAQNYTKYEMDKVGMTYEPRCPTSTAGRVGMAYLPRVTDPTPSTFEQLMSIPGAVAGPVWQALNLNIPKNELQGIVRAGEHFTDDSTVTNALVYAPMAGWNATPNEAPGRFCYATEGGAAFSHIGDLFIGLAGKFLGAVLPSLLASHEKMRDVAPAGVAFLANIGVHNSINRLGVTSAYTGGVYTLTFPKRGKYAVHVNGVAVGTTHTGPITSATSTATVSTHLGVIPATVGTQTFGAYTVVVANEGEDLELTFPNKAAAGTGDNLYIEVYKKHSKFAVF